MQIFKSPKLSVLTALRAFAAALALLASAAAQAQAYPSRPVRIVMPFAPGGATDVLARMIGQRLTQSLGQPFIVENKPGADSALGTSFVAKSAPDGYTLLFTNDATFVLNPLLFQNLPYNIARDFVPVATVSYLNLALVVPASLGVNSFAELVAYTKANSGKLSYGSTGVGGQTHLMGEMYKKTTGADIVHIPYKSTGPVLTEVLAGRLVFGFGAISSIQGFLKDGRLKALAISGEIRSPQLPNVPTFSEVGFKDMDIGAWNAFLAPAGTPRDVVAKLNGAINAALSDPEVEKDFAARGMLPMKRTPEQFADYIRSESNRMGAIVKASGAKVE